MNLRELFFYAVKRGNCYVLPALRFIKLICKMQNVTEQKLFGLFIFVILFLCCDCNCLHQLFLLDGKTADFKGHKELIYDKNKDDNKVDKVDWRLETQRVSYAVKEFREDAEEDKDYTENNPEKCVLNAHCSLADKFHSKKKGENTACNKQN